MNLDKIYYTAEGKECNILKLVKLEPEWAANNIQTGEKAIAQLLEAQEEIEVLKTCRDHWKTSFEKVISENKMLREEENTMMSKILKENNIEIENLKCCGNCAYSISRNCTAYEKFRSTGEYPTCDCCCDKWVFDGQARKERELL